MKTFNVLIENNGKFQQYDIMPYLKNEWKEFLDKIAAYGEEDSDYWKYPKTYDEIKNWVDSRIKYRYWARCEYEMVLSQWPPYTNDRGEEIIKGGKKIDIYEQCAMNMDIIVRMFIENIYLCC